MLVAIFLALYLLSFLTLGLWIGLKALERRWLPKEFLYIAAVAASLTVYYGVFYLYLVWPVVAGVIAKAIILLSLAALIRLILDFWKNTASFALVRKYFLIPLLITSGLMLAYSTIFFTCVAKPPSLGGYKELSNQTFCHTAALPFDNSLAFIFDTNILNNQDKRLAIDWNMVDRPPLQIAATLPILDQVSHSSQFAKYYAYDLFSVFLQLSWIGALWGAFQILKFNRKFQILAFTALSSTGFFYLNSVFVWPKLLSASLVCTAIFILLGKNKPSKYRYWPFAALLTSLGILSHSAVLFTLIPFFIYYLVVLVRSRKIDVRYFGTTVLIALLMLAPWLIYKDSVTKTDRLSKWHFAGVISTDDKRGTVETIVDQYKKLSFGEWAHDKTLNVETLYSGTVGPTPGCSFTVHHLIVDKCLLTHWRTVAFFSTFFAFETLALGWLAVIYRFVRGKIDLLDKELLLIIFGGLAVWVLMMFQPGATVVHQGSYATMMLAFLLIIKKLSELPRFFMGSIAVLQVILFYLTWVTPYFRLG